MRCLGYLRSDCTTHLQIGVKHPVKFSVSARVEMWQTQMMQRQESNSSEHRDSEDAYIRYLPLYRAIDNGNLDDTKSLLGQNDEALTASLSADGDTALHIAVLAGNVEIVRELVRRMSREDLARTKEGGSTALEFAAIGGTTEIAELLVEKNRGLLTIANQHKQIPVIVAALYGHKHLVHVLYRKTPPEQFDPARTTHGAILVTACITDELYDIALELVKQYPQLAIAEDTDKDTALHVLAQKPSAFPSGTQLAVWQKWVYKFIQVRTDVPSITNSGENQKLRLNSVNRQNRTSSMRLSKLLDMLCKGLQCFIPMFTHIYKLKKRHIQTQELLGIICQEISKLGGSPFEELRVKKCLFEAVKNGIVEVITEIMRQYPEALWFNDKKDRNIFFIATAERQETIFSLIYKMGAKKNSLASNWDKEGNTLLHHAAFLAPSAQLDRVSGAALQMQRELQWFKEVESIVQPRYKELLNIGKRTPRSLFSDQHRKLVEQGEKWTKETAESFTLVAALIVTIMFSAAFTFPGGYNNNGGAYYLHRNSFLVFMVSDALSLFSSTTSLVVFLDIMTTRYREEDFLRALPTKLMIGLSALFFSIATMMIAFGVTVVLILRDRIGWVSFPIMLLAAVPVILFAMLQFPLLVEIMFSTYGPGIFNKPKKPLLSC